MSTAIIKNSKRKDLLVCRTCLATEMRLYNICENNLLEAYKTLIGNQVSPHDRLPQHVCVYCAALLLKFNTFRINSRLVQEILEETNHIQTTLTNKYQISLTKSATKIIDVTQNDFFELNPDNEEQNFDYTESDDSKIITDIIKDETPLTEYIKTSKKPRQIKGLKTKKKYSKSKKDCSNSSRNISLINSNVKKKGKYFETDENMRDFENDYNVEVIVLSSDQQKEDVLSRKLSSNYLQCPYKCELCYKGVMDEDSLKKHVLYQHDPSRGPIVCQYCSFRYKDRRGLNQHLKSHRLKFACRQCPHVCRTTFNAKEHYKMHTGLTHRCRHCGRSYEKLSSHLTHLRTQHPSHFIWCDFCGEAFIGQFGLNAHKKRAHRHLSLPYRCVSCSASFVSETALRLHSSYEHCPTVNCVHCGDSFEKDLSLRDHLLEKHRVCKVYKCEKCNKTFSRQSLHSAHYRRTHVDGRAKGQVSKPWVCEVCGKTLPNKSVLLYHQRNHTGERPYQCSLCNKSFTMRKLLQSHLRVHSTDRPYTCEVCPKAFKGLSALRAHEHVADKHLVESGYQWRRVPYNTIPAGLLCKGKPITVSI